VLSSEFISIFPEFSDLVKYPTSRINFYLDYASKLINPLRWGDLTTQGIALLAAHQLILLSLDTTSIGLDSGQSADGISYSLDNKIAFDNAGAYNRTLYGIQYYQLSLLAGSGPLYYAN
jgi:hypothetical protein